MNLLFQTRKPRPFHLARTYRDERRDRLAAIEQRAREELDGSVFSAVHGCGTDPEDVRARIHAAFSRSDRRRAALPLPAIFGGAILLLFLLYILLS